MISPLTPVISSNLNAVGHDPVNNILVVEFKNKKRYSYENVKKDLYDKILAAESVGKVFIAEVKNKPEMHPFKEAA